MYKRQTELNIAFRHEVTHNLQHLNGGCGSGVRSEWGADYNVGSSYYSFDVKGKCMRTSELAQAMRERGCSNSQLSNAALCKSGSYDILSSSGCLLGSGDIADGFCYG